ncbi:hypothetical protein K469DRAFT_297784 [Zopfia rhizophila CBS 207.26]|uniref:Uncharacterized protein n=1 Tax=Zopfia rhizophila CBS 207.26 TaxID=1314779 RepID=A0A6A6DQE1_9PEZI|nr:hypothetical protein K469DRAFT_297784 [Zopfia rhizophila CBS 207.26]
MSKRSSTHAQEDVVDWSGNSLTDEPGPSVPPTAEHALLTTGHANPATVSEPAAKKTKLGFMTSTPVAAPKAFGPGLKDESGPAVTRALFKRVVKANQELRAKEKEKNDKIAALEFELAVYQSASTLLEDRARAENRAREAEKRVRGLEMKNEKLEKDKDSFAAKFGCCVILEIWRWIEVGVR